MQSKDELNIQSTEGDAREQALVDPTSGIDTPSDAPASRPVSTLNDVMFNTSAGHIAHKILGFLDNPARGALAKTSREFSRLERVDRALTDGEFKIQLMNEILAVLLNEEYAANFKVSRNPSGFLRINNDLISLIENPQLLKALPGAAELRLNFWPGELYTNLGAKLEKETAHSHPKGFVSFIVNGSYKHDLHMPSTDSSDPSFMVFDGVETDGVKRFAKRSGSHHLRHVNLETVSSENPYIYFGSTDMVHQVATRVPAKSLEEDHGTLSVNVVFAPTLGKPIKYSLYMHDESSLVERYEQLDAARAVEALTIITTLLKKGIDDLQRKLSIEARTPVEGITPRASQVRETFFSRAVTFGEAVKALNSAEDSGVELSVVRAETPPMKASSAAISSEGITVKI